MADQQQAVANPPSVVWSGAITLLGIELRCHVLDDGQRVIDPESVAAFCRALESGAEVDPAELERFGRWMHGADRG